MVHNKGIMWMPGHCYVVAKALVVMCSGVAL